MTKQMRLVCAALAVLMLAMLAVPLFPARAEDVSGESVPTETVTEEPVSEDVTGELTEEPATEPSTDPITETVTEAPTAPKREEMTEAVTEAPTQRAPDPVTEAPTQRAPDPVTEAPAQPATDTPAEAPSEDEGAEKPVSLRAAKAAVSSPWTFHNSGWGSGETWYIYCPPGSMYSKFSAEKDGTTKPAYCLDRDLSSPGPSVNYQVASYPTTKHYQVAKLVAALGYPNNSPARIKEMTSYDLTAIQAQQATQVAIGAAQKAVKEGWSANTAYNNFVGVRSGYQSVYDYSKALCTRALELLNDPGTAAKYTITPTVTSTALTSKIAVSITPYRAYGNYKIIIKNLPAGTLLTTGQNTRVVGSDGTLSTASNQAVSGTVTIRGLAGTSGANVAKFTLSSIPRGTSDRTITISTVSFAKLAATNEVEWGKSPDSSHQNMFIAGMSEGTTVSASNTAVIPKKPVGSITVVKRDATNNKTLAGCVFGLKKWNGSAYIDAGVTKTTGSDGKAAFTGLTTDSASGGKYQVYEVSAPEGYDSDAVFFCNFVISSGWYKYKSKLVSEMTDTLSNGDTVNATVNGATRSVLTVSKSGDSFSSTVYQYDTPTPPDSFDITLNKRDIKTGNAITGATYQLYTANASGAWVPFRSAAVNSSGSVVLTGLLLSDSSNGTFRVVESEMNNTAYRKDDTFAVTLNPSNGQWSYVGAFANKSGTFTSASTVSASISIPGGGSVSRSIIAGTKPDSLWDFTVWQDDNRKAEHHLSVRKLVNVADEQWPVSGMVFTLLKQNGSQWQSVGTLAEDQNNPGTYRAPESNGDISWPLTENGVYKVAETTSVNGVVNAGWTSPTFVWHENESFNLSYTAVNDYPRGHIGIQKMDSEKNTPIQGVGFRITAAEDITVRIGTRSKQLWPAGTVVNEGQTNAQGRLLFENLPYGKYTVTETSHPANYAYEDLSFPVTVAAPEGYSNGTAYATPQIGFAAYPAGMAVTTAGGLRYVTVGNAPIHPKMAVAKLTERTVNDAGTAVAFDSAKGRYTQQKVPGTYYNGQNAKFSVTVTNTGDVELYDLRVADVMSPSLWAVVRKNTGSGRTADVFWRQKNDTPLALGAELVTGSQVTTAKGGKAKVTGVEYDDAHRSYTITFDRLAAGDSFCIQITCPIFNSLNLNQHDLPNDVYLYSRYKVNGTQGALTDTPGGGEGDCHDLDKLNVVSQGNITLHKRNRNGQSLGGVHFTLYDAQDRQVPFVLLDNGSYAASLQQGNGDWISAAGSGRSVTVDLITDSNGEISLLEVPEGRYSLVETMTVDGQTLLPSPVEIEMPVVRQGSQIEYEGNQFFDGANHFYELDYTITNSAQPALPHTGGTGIQMPVLLGCVLTLGCLILLGLRRRRARSRVREK